MNINLSKGIYLSGFARGGTTWARKILSIHPNVYEVSKQVGLAHANMQLFDEKHISDKIKFIMQSFSDSEEEMAKMISSENFIIKAPPNSLIMSETIDLLPDAKHIFILRDPRDVLVSHQRTGVAWTESHKNFDMAVERTAAFFKGYEKNKKRKNLLLFKYEDVHQNFPETYRSLCEFLNLDVDSEFIARANRSLSFRSQTGRGSHEEQGGMYRRGVVGDWVHNLSYSDGMRFKQSSYWNRVMDEYDYKWDTISVAKILSAVKQAKVNAMPLNGGTGVHVLWSITGGDWDYLEAVKGVLRRIDEGLNLNREACISESFMLGEPLPNRIVTGISSAIKQKPIFLEINADSYPEKKPKMRKKLDQLIDEVVPIIKAISKKDVVEALIFGERIDLYPNLIKLLSKRGIKCNTINQSEGNPIAWVVIDDHNTLTTYGLPGVFDLSCKKSWVDAKHYSTYIIGKIAASSIHDPLSLGFRTCFDDVRNLA